MRFSDYPLLKQMLCGFMYYSGLLSIWKTISGNSQVILYYHEVVSSEDDTSWCREPSLMMPNTLFEKQIKYLKKKYDVVNLDEESSGRSIAITFDDGYRGNYKHAYPILKKYKLSATVFLVTGSIGSSKVLWWEDLISRFEQVYSISEEKRADITKQAPVKWKWLFTEKHHINNVLAFYKTAEQKDKEELKIFLSTITEAHPGNNQRIFLSEEEIREMSGSGITFGAHTVNHPLLPDVDEETLDLEISESRDKVLELTGCSTCWFAYPDGVFAERELNKVSKSGFTGAVQTYRNTFEGNKYARKRVGMNLFNSTGFRGTFSPAVMESRIAGLSRDNLKNAFRSLYRNTLAQLFKKEQSARELP